MTNSLLDPQPDDQISIDESKDYYSELVGEGKKFKDNAELAKGKWYSDQMIALQNKRLDQMRTDFIAERNENIAKAKLQELVDRLSNTNNSAIPLAKVEDEKPAITEDQIKSLMSSSLREYEVNKRQTDNLNQVQSKLIEKYGANYSSSYSDQLQNLGLSAAQVDNLAKESPQAAIRLLGLEARQTDNFQSPPRSNQRSDNFSGNGPKKRTWAYWQEVKKADPASYLDTKTALQMQKDAIELGDAFCDGDFYTSGFHDR